MNAARRALLALILIALCAGCARAEDTAARLAEKLDIESIQDAASIDVRALMDELLNGGGELDADALLRSLLDLLKSLARDTLPGFAGALFPLLLWAVISQLTYGGGASKAALYACYMACVLTLVERFCAQYAQAERAISSISRLTDALTPMLVTLLTMTGGTRSASLITPMGALASRVLTYLVAGGALNICGVAAALAAVSGLNGGLKLKRLAGLVLSFGKWGMRAVTGAYLALMSTGGLISGAYDGMTLKTAKYAAGNLLPIVGGDVAGTMDSLAASASLVRSAAGLAGTAALVAIWARPAISAALCALACRLSAAIAEPVGDESMLSLMDTFAGVFSMLFAIMVLAISLTLILVGATVGLGARIAG